jgi:hypothetical protein
VSGFAEDFEDYEDEKYESGVYTSHAKSAPQFRANTAPGLPQTTMDHGGVAATGMDMYVGEFGATKNPFGISSSKRNESSSMGYA